MIRGDSFYLILIGVGALIYVIGGFFISKDNHNQIENLQQRVELLEAK